MIDWKNIDWKNLTIQELGNLKLRVDAEYNRRRPEGEAEVRSLIAKIDGWKLTPEEYAQINDPTDWKKFDGFDITAEEEEKPEYSGLTPSIPKTTEIPPVDRSNRCTLSGKPADIECAQTGGAPQPIDPKTGMHKDYWVLCQSERQKGFVRPVRQEYKHVGHRPQYPLRDLTAVEIEHYGNPEWIKFETYPEDHPHNARGRFWTNTELNSGCGEITHMGLALSETYARDPKFYGSTFCSNCSKHFPVGEDGEFVWIADGTKVGT